MASAVISSLSAASTPTKGSVGGGGSSRSQSPMRSPCGDRTHGVLRLCEGLFFLMSVILITFVRAFLRLCARQTAPIFCNVVSFVRGLFHSFS